MVFVYGTLTYDKPFLAPLFAFMSLSLPEASIEEVRGPWLPARRDERRLRVARNGSGCVRRNATAAPELRREPVAASDGASPCVWNGTTAEANPPGSSRAERGADRGCTLEPATRAGSDLLVRAPELPCPRA